MKKIFFIISSFICIQLQAQSTWILGGNTAINYTGSYSGFLKPYEHTAFTYRWGYSLKKRNENRAISVEINHDTRGKDIDSVAFRVDYLNMPLHFTHYFGRNKSFYWNLGIQLGMQTKGRKFFRSGYEEPTFGTKPHTIWAFPGKIELGGIIGGGYEYGINKNWLINVDVRTNISFQDLTDKGLYSAFKTKHYYAISTGLGIHYIIPK